MSSLRAAVIGKDVSKSVSPQMHTFIAEQLGKEIEYKKISIAEEEFENEIESLLNDYDGLNVTIPYKLSVIPYLKRVCGDAKIFSAVNTVTTTDRCGYNTDGAGFALMMRNDGVEVSGKAVLVLGAGGAGRSVAKTLKDGGASVSVYDNRPESARAAAAEFGLCAIDKTAAKGYDIIVNATGVGMHKTEGVSPVGAELLSLCSVAVDLIYVPEKSKLLEIAEGLGKKIINGAAMLFYQAYYAECIFFGLRPDDGQAKSLFEKFKENNI